MKLLSPSYVSYVEELVNKQIEHINNKDDDDLDDDVNISLYLYYIYIYSI
jgi:hypothetical protein